MFPPKFWNKQTFFKQISFVELQAISISWLISKEILNFKVLKTECSEEQPLIIHNPHPHESLPIPFLKKDELVWDQRWYL